MTLAVCSCVILCIRGETLPIDYIFGTPTKREVHGYPVYATGFNLSS